MELTTVGQAAAAGFGGKTPIQWLSDYQQSREPGENEYRGQDGLIYCARCHGPRQGWFTGDDGKRYMMPNACTCRMADSDDKREIEKQNRLNRLRRECFGDKGLINCTFDRDDGKDAEMSAKMRSYVNNWSAMKAKNQGLIIFGGVGVGKTFFAACIANAVVDMGDSALVTSFPEIESDLWSCEDKAAYYNRLARVQLLVIDDFGVERKSDYMLEIIENVINARYVAQKPIIVTTNMSNHELAFNQDLRFQRAYDRLFEYCLPLEMTGPSRRRAEAIKRRTEAAANGI